MIMVHKTDLNTNIISSKLCHDIKIKKKSMFLYYKTNKEYYSIDLENYYYK